MTLLGVAGGLCGNMVVAAAKASPRMACMSLARPRIEDSTQEGSMASSVGLLLGSWSREASIAWPMALASEVEA